MERGKHHRGILNIKKSLISLILGGIRGRGAKPGREGQAWKPLKKGIPKEKRGGRSEQFWSRTPEEAGHPNPSASKRGGEDLQKGKRGR